MARIPAAERRVELIDAAVRVIAESGVDGATTRRIADEANAPLATLHYCFASKEVLFAAVFEHVAGQYRDVLLANDCHGDVRATTRGLLRAMAEWYLTNRETAQAIAELISWAQRQDAQQAHLVYDEAITTMRDIVGAAAESAGQDLEPEIVDELVTLVTTMSDGFALNYLVFPDRDAALHQIDLLVGVLDMWMDARLAAAPADSRSASVVVSMFDGVTPPESRLRSSLVSWVPA
ncbi:TetR/AcrR family transcriptional regulator [Gordonia sp. TBRC 11910]|uniref:TetR/AcrR family transcriptional regulator n=1 Tax=Gordonia asplenii TaxID=2725283 RepID=A0A848KWU5_9ACTN|nr:TetR/AcrR family transcriptional regulator [Gordonia asplenii]NMO00651.1 TetR/AcrR family transcriptional regulator [Gordonia asplenii]